MNQTAHTEKNIELLNLSHPSIKERKGPVIETIMKTINRAGIEIPLSDQDLVNLINEAHSNAMEHGNHWNPKKVVNIRVFFSSRFLSIEITDEGNGFKIDRIQDFNDVFQTKERAGGIQIIKQFCEPTWNEKGNSVSLKIPLTSETDN